MPLLRRNLGCVFQDFKLLPNRTASENVAYALKVQGERPDAIRKKVPEALSLVGLAHKAGSLPDELSGGEQQRVSIARAVVNHPPLLICDEPTGNLDPDTSVGIMQLLYRINRAGHDRADGHPRPRDGRQDAQARDRPRRRPARARRAARRLHDRMNRLRMIVGEAVRSMRASMSTTVAATMTVLVAMLVLGTTIGLGTWLLSYSDHIKQELVVKVYFDTTRMRRRSRSTRSAGGSTRRPTRSSGRSSSSPRPRR